MKRPSKKQLEALEAHRQDKQKELREIALPMAEEVKNKLGDQGGALIVVFHPDKTGHDIFYFEYRGKILNVLGSLEEVRNRLYQLATARSPVVQPKKDGEV